VGCPTQGCLIWEGVTGAQRDDYTLDFIHDCAPENLRVKPVRWVENCKGGGGGLWFSYNVEGLKLDWYCK